MKKIFFPFLLALAPAAMAATWSVDFRPEGGGVAIAANVEAAPEKTARRADYAVYAADEVTGPYRLVENPVIEGNGDLRTFSIAVKSDVKSQFFIVVAATPGYAFPYDFADIQDPQE